MRLPSTFVLCAMTTIGCSSQRDPSPAPKVVDIAATGSAAATAAPASQVAPAVPAAQVAPASAAWAGTKLVDLTTIPDAEGLTDLVRATIDLPSHATVAIETRVANGETISTAMIYINEIEISRERAELTSVDIEVVELPEPGAFEKVKGSYAARDLVRAEKDADGYTFVSRVGHDFAVNVSRGSFLCSAVGRDGNGILEVGVPVVLRACRSLRPKT